MRKLVTYLSILVGAAFLSAGSVAAHPHVWIDVRLQIVFDDAGRLLAIRQNWALDSNFTNIEVMPFVDADGDRLLGPAELERAIAYYFGWITANRYFTHVTVDGTAIRFDELPPPEVTFEDGYFAVEAELQLTAPVEVDETVAIDVFDTEIYNYFDFPRVGFDRPGNPAAADAPVAEDAITAINAPPVCSAGLRPPEVLDPMAVLLLRQLGFAAPNDPAAGFPTRALVVVLTAGSLTIRERDRLVGLADYNDIYGTTFRH